MFSASKFLNLEVSSGSHCHQDKGSTCTTSKKFSHPGCAALRPPQQLTKLFCLACGGKFARHRNKNRFYGYRSSNGRLRSGDIHVYKLSSDDSPESPNDQFCSQACDAHYKKTQASDKILMKKKTINEKEEKNIQNKKLSDGFHCSSKSQTSTARIPQSETIEDGSCFVLSSKLLAIAECRELGLLSDFEFHHLRSTLLRNFMK